LLFFTTDHIVLNCLEKANIITALEYSDINLETIINENRSSNMGVQNRFNKPNIVRHFFCSMVEVLINMKQYFLTF
jgi:hypothetical protein